MAGGADRRTFVLAVAGAGLAMALARFPLAGATRGLWWWAVPLAGLALLGLPVLVAEGALGHYRRRNAVDAHGPGAWRWVGALHAAGAVASIALLAVLAAWSARLAYGSFEGTWFDDPGRHVRLLSAGPDTLLATLGVLSVATGVALRGADRGLRALVSAATVAALLLLGALALWANLRDGSRDGLRQLYDASARGLGASDVVAGLLAGLLPALLATGLATTLAAHAQDRHLPRGAFLAMLLAALGLGAALLFLGPLAASEGGPLAEGGHATYTQVPGLLAGLGHAQAGVLAGSFYAALLLAALVALVGLLEVPATWLAESSASWTERRALLATGLAAYLLAVPFCFSPGGVARLGEALAWVLAPLAGLLVCLHVGWARPQVLDGFRVGDAGHRLDAFLVPALRYAVAPALLLLLVLGALGVAQSAGWATGSGGLWRLVP